MTPQKSGKDDVPPGLARLFGEHEPIAFGTPSQQAEALIVRALMSDDPGECRALAEMAHETDPDNVEALFTLATVSPSVENAKSLLIRAAEIMVQRMGPAVLKSPDAMFANSRDGQSYLTILASLGTFQWAAGEWDAAIESCLEALRMDPLDHLMARINLLSWLIGVGDDEHAGQLLATYPDTPVASWHYSRALWLYRSEGPSPDAHHAIAEAIDLNPITFVALATSALPFDIDALDRDAPLDVEAATYFTTASLAWIESEGALDWLASLVKGDTGSDLPGIPFFSGLGSQRGRRQMGRTDRSPATRSPKAAKLFQIKVSLRRAPKPIWRRLLVEKATTLENLHDIIQLAMGWDDDHLHDFRVGRKRYTVPDDILDPGADGDERGTKLSQVLKRPKDRMVYTYDFGDSWEHDVLLEALVDPAPGVAYPRCVRGARACPPEDCGGAGGYAHLVAALSDPSHPSHQAARSQLGRDYDPNAFDLDAVNRRLDSRLNEEDPDDVEPNPRF